MKSFCALESGDTASFEQIYADDCLLVRPDGDELRKEEILADLREHSMRFTSFDVNDASSGRKDLLALFRRMFEVPRLEMA